MISDSTVDLLYTSPQPITLNTDVLAVAAYSEGVCVITDPVGGVRCWGGWNNELMDSTAVQTDVSTVSPSRIGQFYLTANPPTVDMDGLSGVTQLAFGTDSACALMSGRVNCWGRGGTLMLAC